MPVEFDEVETKNIYRFVVEVFKKYVDKFWIKKMGVRDILPKLTHGASRLYVKKLPFSL